ncbi:MAG: hypothetical protein QM747_04875 [Nocardioides sp.]
MEHGHALLLRVLQERRPDWVRRRGVRMLEIGTTREELPEQDSTRVLSEFCQQHGWSFTTCDMDPANSDRARELFVRMGEPFEAVTAKGEDYVATGRRRFDTVYLDAYDFDHGQHSEARQERYEAHLGSRINQHACEVMHLETMQGLTKSGASRCLVVLDDTWRDDPDGPWQGKGPLAIPWALTHGWELTEEDPNHRAVVLEKIAPAYVLLTERAKRAVRDRRRALRRKRRTLERRRNKRRRQQARRRAAQADGRAVR